MATRMTSATASGRDADSPWRMPLPAWKQVALRTWRESSKDNVGLVAAGVAFYGFLALVPMLGAIVLTYGLAAEPETVIRNMQALTSVMPREAAALIGEQLMNVVETSGHKKGLGILLALALALFGARNGAGAIITALNIAYEEEEKRGFIRVNLLALLMTAAAVAVAILAVLAVGALGFLHELFPNTPKLLLLIGKVAAYGLFVLAAAAGAATLYRYAPSREKAKWSWLTPGSLFVALAWLLLTLGFGLYVSNFGNYDATYGSLGAVIVLLTWLYLSSYVVLFGAELNSELEHQTARDTTSGAPAQMGQRGAWVADHVAGEAAEEPEQPAEPSFGGTAPPPRQPPPQEDGGGGKTVLEQPSFVASRATSRLGRIVGLRRVGLISSVASTIGLALLRKRGKAPQGLALVATAVGLAVASREK